MRPREALRTALENIAAHKLRSSLTMLGIVFGVGAVISMLAIGAGAERQALETLSRLGLDNVIVRAVDLRDEEAEEVRAKSVGVSLRDAEAIVDAVPGVQHVSPKVEIQPWEIRSPEGTVDAQVFGVSDIHAALVNLELAEGRFLDALDVRRHAQVAVVGVDVRRELFGYGEALGQHLKIDDVWLEVVGVLGGESGGEADSFQGVALSSSADTIYLPYSTAMRKFDRRALDSPLAEIIVHLEAGDSGWSVRAAAASIDELLGHLHAGAEDYELVVPEALLAQSRRTQRLFNIVMGCIAGISLLVGGIGIMNIMLASVLERTREIGLRRAVGAKRHDIKLQFLLESFTLSALGGLAGVVMGVAIAQIVAASAGWPTLVQVWSIVLATGVAVTVGVVSGYYPAVRAAELDPIESLRYE
ncbi:MAG: ABC transporter permease [Thermoanaerobaculia bacterium]|nr:ABC transporter permease [Thermoanaerobaculia bacterium]